MGCVRCQNGVWICTDGEASCDQGPAAVGKESMEASAWKAQYCMTLAANTKYYIRCRKGCSQNVIISQSSEVPDHYEDVGDVTLRPQEAGDYAVYCRPGSRQTCDVWLRKLAENEPCPA